MARFSPVLFVLFLIVGCVKEPVREDRAADWGRDGNTVAFQHDQEGVYVADKHGRQLTKIFEPDESVLATSRPLYSPTDGRLIFTTAQDPDGQPRSPGTNLFPADPAGNVVSQRPVKYTCWLRGDASGDDQPAPKRLFTARCEHIGYIAAGLAVRWHPDGQRLLFVDSAQNSSRQHGIYEFDLRTEKTRCVFPHRADAVIFDFNPRGSQLVCVTGAVPSENGRSKVPAALGGLWIGNPEIDDSWWKVPGTGRLAAGELPSLIENLRASRPAWTADDAQFACVVAGPERVENQAGKSCLQVTRVVTRTPQTIYECDGRLADLNWSADGTKLGFIERRSDGNSALRIYENPSGISEPVNTRPVRKFAGFDRTGERVAYVVPDESELADSSHHWALILIPDRLVRDAVLVAEPKATEKGAEVFTGMRVTFPVWSPTEDRLSLWITFVPRYQSLLSILARWGLWPGDPAATLDLATGEISWLAVTPAEELQVGHYYLLKKDYARAWEWYERANQKLPPRKPPKDLAEFIQTIGAPERSQLFEYHCLMQLGRHEAAAARLLEFEQNFFPAEPAAGDAAARALDDVFRQFGRQARLLKRLIHDLYAAEVFLSVDAADAGIDLFRQQLQSDNDFVNRLSRSMALSQALLIAGRCEEYLSVCTDLVVPAALAAWDPDENAISGNPDNAGRGNEVLKIMGGLCLAPLFRPDFLAGIPESALRAAVEQWEARRAGLDNGYPALAIDLFLRAAHMTLADAEHVQAIETRLGRNPATTAAFGDKPLDEAIGQLFATASPSGPSR